MSMTIEEMAKKMGSKGGKNRAKNLSKERLSEIGRNAGIRSAEVRWGKKPIIKA